ncbi:MAG: CBS domain-containing protein [Oscillospiraceae bacterium]|nr:CBS domain-containing protein [Oscillospiraceae bacterium]
MTVKDVMSSKVCTVTRSDTAADAARVMNKYDIGSVPVVENENLCGIITDRDIVIRCIAGGRQPDMCKINDIMSPATATVTSEQSLAEAERLMSNAQVRRLPVVASGRLEGIVSLADIARIRPTAEIAKTLSEISMP